MTATKMHDVYLGLGTNLGDKERNIQLALNNIEERIGSVASCSAFFVTEPVGFISENNFVNAACLIRTLLGPIEVLRLTKQIETEMGRTAKSVDRVYADRIIDIDILLYDDCIITSDELVLPHPFLHQRAFVLQPLNEIAAHVVHPLLKKTIGQLSAEL